MRELKRSQERRLLGVAGGMAEYFDIDPVLMRAVWILVSIPFPPAIFAYIILGLVLPDSAGGARSSARPKTAPPEEDVIDVTPPRYEEKPYKRMTKSRDRWISGVAGGIAEYLNVDPILIRVLFLAAFFMLGTGILLYLILAIIMPQPDR